MKKKEKLETVIFPLASIQVSLYFHYFQKNSEFKISRSRGWSCCWYKVQNDFLETPNYMSSPPRTNYGDLTSAFFSVPFAFNSTRGSGSSGRLSMSLSSFGLTLKSRGFGKWFCAPNRHRWARSCQWWRCSFALLRRPYFDLF